MDVSQQLVALGELANLDAKMKTVKDRLEVVPARAKKADTEVEALRKKLDDVEKKKETAERTRRALDGDLVAERAKMKKWESRADSIRGEREHEALSSEIGAQKRTLRDLEEKILEQMQLLEDTAIEQKALAPKHKSAVDEAAVEWKNVKAELDELNGQVAGLTKARDAVLATLPPTIVKRYAQVAEKRQGIGVAIISKETCSGCKRTIPPQMSLMIQKGVVLESCPSCSRYLVHETMTRAPAAPNEAAP